MSNFFSSPETGYKNVGQWPGARGFQARTYQTAEPLFDLLSANLGPAMELFRRTAAGEDLDVTQDPNIQRLMATVLGPAKEHFEDERQALSSQYHRKGLGFSSKRTEALTELTGEQGRRLEDTLFQLIYPEYQQRRLMQYSAAEMPLRILDQLRSLGTAGAGQTVPVTYGPSPFSQLLGLGLQAHTLGAFPHLFGGDTRLLMGGV